MNSLSVFPTYAVLSTRSSLRDNHRPNYTTTSSSFQSLSCLFNDCFRITTPDVTSSAYSLAAFPWSRLSLGCLTFSATITFAATISSTFLTLPPLTTPIAWKAPAYMLLCVLRRLSLSPFSLLFCWILLQWLLHHFVLLLRLDWHLLNTAQDIVIKTTTHSCPNLYTAGLQETWCGVGCMRGRTFHQFFVLLTLKNNLWNQTLWTWEEKTF